MTRPPDFCPRSAIDARLSRFPLEATPMPQRADRRAQVAGALLSAIVRQTAGDFAAKLAATLHPWRLES